MDLWEIENELHRTGIGLICGVDEAGRGPLAGPVCAAAVILPENLILDGLNDSKKLSEKKREQLFPMIQEQALDFAVAFASVDEIEELNILNATFLAMNRAVESLKLLPELALIDGNRNSGIRMQSRCIVGGDGKCASIAAASVLAKVSRDRLMLEYAERFPEYGFEKHKGYGTEAHYEALRRYGPSPIHRMSFLKRFYSGGEWTPGGKENSSTDAAKP
ncbi:MAG: ribonuclease HII [Oscillospiraceae bacterium]|nr:ribonuclease HII [Oscillospiraceae bacterium]